MNINILMAFTRLHHTAWIIKHLEQMNIILYPLIQNEYCVFPNMNWIKPILFIPPSEWINSHSEPYYKYTQFILTQPIIDDDYYCILNDDDAYEHDFILKLKETIYNNAYPQIIVTSMKRCCDILNAKNMGLFKTGVEQMIFKGSFFRNVRYGPNMYADGHLANALYQSHKHQIYFAENLYVLFNYLEPNRWVRSPEPYKVLKPNFYNIGECYSV